MPVGLWVLGQSLLSPRQGPSLIHFSVSRDWTLDPGSRVEMLSTSLKQPPCGWLLSASMSPLLSGATQGPVCVVFMSTCSQCQRSREGLGNSTYERGKLYF